MSTDPSWPSGPTQPIEHTEILTRIAQLLITMSGDADVPHHYRQEMVDIISKILLSSPSTSGTEVYSSKDPPTGGSGSSGSSESGHPSP